VLGLPLLIVLVGGLENRIHRKGEPPFDAAVEKPVGIGEYADGRNQSERHERNQQAGLELRAGLLLLPLNPDFDDGPQQDESEDEKHEKDQRREGGNDDDILRFGRIQKSAKIERLLGK